MVSLARLNPTFSRCILRLRILSAVPSITGYILGVRPDYNGLVIDPCIPKKWRSFKVKRVFRGATYDIEVKNPKGVNKGIKSLKADGMKLGGNVVPVYNDKKVHKVEVVMG